ncbi:hypothetical protein D9M68_972210 [compost metagenome]
MLSPRSGAGRREVERSETRMSGCPLKLGKVSDFKSFAAKAECRPAAPTAKKRAQAHGQAPRWVRARGELCLCDALYGA